ncbi:MAG: hypothetical protein SFW35_08445 [Chitinophagales bacterium]|nr:hypothetical protein [Chitinophagales bacterium]
MNFNFYQMAKIGIAYLAITLCMLSANETLAQANGDYRTQASGNWNSTTTWQTYSGGAWGPAAVTPTNTNGVITISHNVTVTANVSADQVTVDAGASVTVNTGVTWTLANGTGTDLTVNGTVTNTGTITFTGNAAFNSGALYNHNINSLTLPTSANATWANDATISINGITTAGTLAVNARTFGNFIYNSAATINAVDGTLTVNGNATFSAGTFNLANSTTTRAMNLGGKLLLNGGNFVGNSTTSAATLTFVNAGIATGGIEQVSGTLSGVTITVNSGRTVSLESNVTYNTNNATARILTVNSLGIFDANNFVLSGSGGFTISTGGTLRIGSAAGITSSGTTGNIQVSGTRSFGLGGNYVYEGTNGQVTGNGLAANNTGSVTLDMVNNSDQLTFTNTAAIGTNGRLRIINGQVANGITYGLASTLEYAGTTAQTTTNNEFPAASGPYSLEINNAAGVILHAARSLSTAGVLILTQGTLTTTATNLISVTNTAVGGITFTSGFINGPVNWSLASTSTSVYVFPVGKSALNPITLDFDAANGGAMVVRAEVFEAVASGSAGWNMANIGSMRWELTKVSGTGNINGAKVILEASGIVDRSRVAQSSGLSGVYDNIGGSGPGGTITSGNFLTGGFFAIGDAAGISGTYSVGPGNPVLLNLTRVAETLNSGYLTGNAIFEMQTTYNGTTGETFPIVFNQYMTDGGSYSVIIRPASGAPLLTTSGIPGSGLPLIDLDGADNLIFDGRAGGTGSTIGWLFRNTQTAATVAPTFRLINDASDNTLRYLQVEGSNSSSGLSTAGTILISNTTLTTGNDNNSFSNLIVRERTDGAFTLPAFALYSYGIAGKTNDNIQVLDCEFINYWSTTGSSYGVYAHTYSSDWKIKRNSFYQTANRAGVANSSHHPISINNTGVNFEVDSNYIGGTAALASGGTYTVAGTASGTFCGIYFNPNTGAAGGFIRGNVIRNISWAHGGGTSSQLFVGIRNANGNTVIDGNIIGAGTGTGNITIISQFHNTMAAHGIYIDAGVVTISNNVIGAINVTGTNTTSPISFYGIYSSSPGNFVVDGNNINNISITSFSSAANASYPQLLAGIQFGLGGGGLATISNNTISNLSNAYTSTNLLSGTKGIISGTAGQFNISGNTISDLSAANAAAVNGTQASVVGIAIPRNVTTFGHTISNNVIRNLSNTNASASAVRVIGIFYAGPTSGTHKVERNIIHSFTAASTNIATLLTGIYDSSGLASFENNMVRLGIDASGNSITRGYVINGIEVGSATANTNFYFNSVYIGGSGVANPGSSTAAFIRTPGTTASAIQNNIFYNARGNSTTGGSHYAINLNASTGITSNFNILLADGTGGLEGRIATTDYATLPLWQGTGLDASSVSADPRFENASGNSASVSLKISTTLQTPVEGGGTSIPSVTLDQEGNTRSGLTPVDIGADAGDFVGQDLINPVITYTPLGNATTTANRTLTANITDNYGISTGANAPRLYFRKNGGSWVNVNATSIVADDYTFTFDYGLVGGVTGGEYIEYYVAAQDDNSNMVTNPVGGSGANPPGTTAPGTLNSYIIAVFNGVVNVGSTENIQSITNNNGLFNLINTGAVTGNVTVNITSDLTAETGTHALNEFTAPYRITIQSNNSTPKEISGTHNGTNLATAGLIRLNGADRVNINGGSGSDRRLIIRNATANTFASALSFLNDAQNNKVNNVTLEAASSNTGVGVVNFGASAASGAGNDNDTLINNDIRDLSTVANTPVHLIYSSGTSGRENSNILVQGNNIYNNYSAGNTCTGLNLQVGNRDWVIKGNSFYQTVTRSGAAGTTLYAVFINNGTIVNVTVDSNYVGGTAPLTAGGPLTINGSFTNRFIGITATTSSSSVNNIRGNVISNISLLTTSASSSPPSSFAGIDVSSGDVNIIGNVIGAATGNGSITLNANQPGCNGYGINNSSSGDVVISNNIIGSITTAAATLTNSFGFTGIYNSSGIGIVDITDNIIGSATTTNSINLSAATTVTATGTAQVFTGIYSTGSGGGIIDILRNTVRNIQVAAGNITNSSAQFRGISVTGASLYTIEQNVLRDVTCQAANSGTSISATTIGLVHSGGGTLQNVNENQILNIRNTSTAGTANLYGIVFNGSTSTGNSIQRNAVYSLEAANSSATTELIGINLTGGSATIANNMVRLGVNANGSLTNNAHVITGIQYIPNTAGEIYHNTVYIGGTANSTGVANTHAFRRVSTSGGHIIRNNIFANGRTGGNTGSNHYSFVSANTTGFGTFDNNIFSSADGSLFSTNGGTSALTAPKLQALRAATSPVNNTSSGVATLAQINFLDTDGDISNVDLRLNNPTVAADAGATGTGVTTDFDALTRNSPPDIGADEGAFSTLNSTTDIYTPSFAFSPIASQGACSPVVNPTITVTITDRGTGIATGANAPRIYYQRILPAATAWVSAPGTFVSSSGDTTVWSFTVDYSLLSLSPAANEEYNYYFVAQDQAATPNVWYSTFNASSPIFTNVNTPTTSNGATFTLGTNRFKIMPTLSGTVTVGTGGTFTSFQANNSSGLFYTLNNGALSGHLTVRVLSDINESANWYPLATVTEVCGNNYTLTIVPNDSVNKTISGTTVNALFEFNGVTRMVIDGRDQNNLAGNGRFLTFRHTTNNPTMKFNNGSNNITVRNCVIEGNNTVTESAASGNTGVVLLGGTIPTGNGENNITFESNWIRNRSDLAQNATNRPSNLFVSQGHGSGAAQRNRNITLSNNEFSSFSSTAIGVFNTSSYYYNGSGFNITGNKIYMPAATAGSTNTYGIYFDAGTASISNTISNNVIGGSAANGTGTFTVGGANEMWGIYASTGGSSTTDATLISGNTISNILMSGTGFSNFIGILTDGDGYYSVENNIIGSTTTANSIQLNGGEILGYLIILFYWAFGMPAAKRLPSAGIQWQTLLLRVVVLPIVLWMALLMAATFTIVVLTTRLHPLNAQLPTTLFQI